jgi:hypothetical protein
MMKPVDDKPWEYEDMLMRRMIEGERDWRNAVDNCIEPLERVYIGVQTWRPRRFS